MQQSMNLCSNRTGVLCQLAFDRIIQADFSVDECGNGLLEVGIALAVGAKTALLVSRRNVSASLKYSSQHYTT
jgi:hypothetical protein